MYIATVDQQNFKIEFTEDGFLANGQLITCDIANLTENRFHILHQSKSYRAEIVKIDRGTKAIIIKINNRSFSVQLKDKFDLLLEKMGIANNSVGKVNIVKAPMPGLIVGMKVKEGDAVKANDALLVLEAMKMENTIKSPADGIVKSIKVKAGDNVEKNQVLIEF